ncbi:NAD-dependent epimerase/dehydratase family protein [Aestuariibius sp. 2305UL40-4]|uniref:NAD-dependent epimerase/dehydratase family protein n=1 Tax=Aestuariibius violaceus TaxID=3234132 RepID=UPI00345EDF8C
MRCLVVGGTGFLGGAIADALIDAGHSVAILSRGETDRVSRASAEIIQADRYGPLDALGGYAFDWVFDSCAYSPDALTSLLPALGDGVGRYVLISSISAYGTFRTKGLDETADVPGATEDDLEVAAGLPPERRASAFAYGASYGPLKRACEVAAEDVLGDRATSLRVGLLVGAGDYTDRLTWWVRRIDTARGERRTIPAPAPEDRPVQLIDVRDAAEFAVLCASDGLAGIWNVTGAPVPFSEVLHAIRDLSQSEAAFVWVDEEKIARSDVAPWVDIPMMAPPLSDFRYFLEVSTAKATAAGLICRPLKETLAPLLDWDLGRREVDLKGGMSAEQEERLLV